MIRVARLVAIFALFLGLLALGEAPSLHAQTRNEAASDTGKSKTPPRRAVSTGTRLATGELLRIEQEAEQLNQQLAALTSDAATAQQLADVRPQVAALLPQAETICTVAEDAPKQEYFAQVRRIIERAGQVIGDSRPGPWASPPTSLQEMCEISPAAILREIDAQIAGAERAAQGRATVLQQLSDLDDRREQVLGEMTDNLAGNSIANRIPLLMLIIFGVGAGTLAGVWLFPDKIQQELIGSGQIVQFVTILILLGVILSLGMAQRLQAETLGTLLGGIAGYVLSQGVGRQAQQRVINELRSVAAAPPPRQPPSPPPPPPPSPPPSPPPPDEPSGDTDDGPRPGPGEEQAAAPEGNPSATPEGNQPAVPAGAQPEASEGEQPVVSGGGQPVVSEGEQTTAPERTQPQGDQAR